MKETFDPKGRCSSKLSSSKEIFDHPSKKKKKEKKKKLISKL
jgi:hypothetical protein